MTDPVPDAEYAALLKQLEALTAKGAAGSIAERMALEKKISEILVARRRSDRFQCTIKVMLLDLGKEGVPGTLLNIGAGGAYVKTKATPQKFSRLRLEVKSAGRLPLGLIYGLEVRWVKTGDGLGVAFVDVGAKEAEALRRLLADLVREQPPQPQ